MDAPGLEIPRKTYGNVWCTPTNRCGKCTRDVQAAIKFRIDAARIATKLLPRGQQVCCECGVTKAFADFNLTKLNHPGARCRMCEAVQRRVWNTKRNARDTRPNHGTKAKYPCMMGCGASIGRKGGRCLACYKLAARTPAVRKAAPIDPQTQYACLGNCGLLMDKRDGYCIPCKRQRQEQIAASSEQKMKRSRVLKSFMNGTALGIMHVGDDAFALSVRCQHPSNNTTYTTDLICGKPILVGPKCYFHATGRPRTLTVLARIELPDGVKPDGAGADGA